MKKGFATTINRVVLGLIFVVFGLNGFFHFIPMDGSDHSKAAQSFLGGLSTAPYMFPLIKSIEVFAGLGILAGFFVPLCLVVLFPVSLNILLYHSFLDSSDMTMSIVIIVSHLTLVWYYRGYYCSLLNRKANPSSKITCK